MKALQAHRATAMRARQEQAAALENARAEGRKEGRDDNQGRIWLWGAATGALFAASAILMFMKTAIAA